MSIPAYPLQWPEGWPREQPEHRTRARFSKRRGASAYGGNWRPQKQLSVAQATDRLRGELQRMGIHDEDMVISTDLKLRLDGFPRSSQAEPDDPGAAVYWRTVEGETRCMAIDRYDRIADNLAAIAATLEAMRAIERHGGAAILDRAFTGFTALEGPGSEHWSTVLGVDPGAGPIVVQTAYRAARRRTHPDTGGNAEDFHRIQRAWEQYQQQQGFNR